MKRNPIIFLFVQFFCEHCGYYFTVQKNDLRISAKEQDCELCGSHGDITFLDIKCPRCYNIKNVKAKEW